MKAKFIAVIISVTLGLSVFSGCGSSSQKATAVSSADSVQVSADSVETTPKEEVVDESTETKESVVDESVANVEGKSDSEKSAEDETEEVVASSSEEKSGIVVEEHLFSVEVTVPGDLFTNEGEDAPTQESLDALAQEEGGDISYTLNEDGSVTCKMSKAQQKEMLDELKQGVDEYFTQCTDPESDNYFASYKEIEYNDDLSEANILVDPALYGGFDAFGGFGIIFYGYYYQAFSGVPEDEIKSVVHFIDADGNVIESVDSDTLFDAEEG